MSKHKEVSPTLVSQGIIDFNLHYGPFAHHYQRFTPEDMHQELVEESVHNAQFSHDEIPEVETIHNWVSRYSAEMKKDVADKMLANYNK
nr:2716_t:CDS:2 [Entrophospora candida]